MYEERYMSKDFWVSITNVVEMLQMEKSMRKEFLILGH